MTKSKFENVVGLELPLNDDYPCNSCADCNDRLENFYFYKNLLKKKQNELEEFLKNNIGVEENLMLIEDDDSLMLIEEDVEAQEAMNDDTENDSSSPLENLENAPDTTIQEEHLIDYPAAIHDDIEPTNSSEGGVSQQQRIVIMPNIKSSENPCKNFEELNELMPMMVTTDSCSSLFACPICSSAFKLENECRDHIKDHKFDFGPQQCEHCTSTFKTLRFYHQHLQKMHNGETLICHICAKVFVEDRRKFQQHVKNHETTKKFSCKMCSKMFRHSQHLVIHMRSHTNEYPYLCSVCPARFRTSYNLNVHSRSHKGEFKKCPQCSAEFLTNSALKNHLLRCDGRKKRNKVGRLTLYARDDNQRSFKCFVDGCESEHKTKSELHVHLANIHRTVATDLTCLECGEELESSASLRHHTRVHLGFNCPNCNIPLTTAAKLSDHVAKVHQDDEHRPHQCQFEGCKSNFKRLEHLKSHTKFRHSKEKPFKCDLCPFAAAVRYELNHHMKTHKTEKTFKCRICDYGCHQSNALRKHMEVMHEGSSDIYFCEFCSIGFKYLSVFNEHNRSNH